MKIGKEFVFIHKLSGNLCVICPVIHVWRGYNFTLDNRFFMVDRGPIKYDIHFSDLCDFECLGEL